MEVLTFLETYEKLCHDHEKEPIQPLMVELKKVVDGINTIPDTFKLNGNSPDLSQKRLTVDHLSLLIPPMTELSIIRHLDLSYNCLQNEGALLLASYLKTNKTLDSLNIAYNDITSDGGIAIADELCINSTLTQLDIGGNELGDSAGMKFAAMLQVNVTLETITFKSCSFGARSLVALSSVLSFSTVVRQLDLSDNVNHFNSLTQSLQTDIINHLAKAMQISSSLKELNISKLAITDWNMLDYLAYAIRYCISLEVLDLSSNKFGKDGGAALFGALHRHQTLSTLKVNHCHFQNAGANAAAHMLKNNNKLKRLYMAHCGITSEGLCYIAESLDENTSLNTLHLWGNEWDTVACAKYADLLGISKRSRDIGDRSDQLTIEKLEQLNKLKAESKIMVNAQALLDVGDIVDKRARLDMNRVDFYIYWVESIPQVAYK